MKNEKGFTLIEIIATIVIIGIIGTIAGVGVTRYLAQSKERAYDLLHETVYEAVSNCISESNCMIDNDKETTFEVSELKSKGYIDSFKNPSKNSGECSGSVTVKKATTDGNIKEDYTINGNKPITTEESYTKYLYKVNVNCNGMNEKETYWPQGTTASDWEK